MTKCKNSKFANAQRAVGCLQVFNALLDRGFQNTNFRNRGNWVTLVISAICLKSDTNSTVPIVDKTGPREDRVV